MEGSKPQLEMEPIKEEDLSGTNGLSESETHTSPPPTTVTAGASTQLSQTLAPTEATIEQDADTSGT